MTKEFVKLLEQNNISVPKNRILKAFFEKKWRDVFYEYIDYMEEVKQSTLKDYPQSMRKSWGDCFPDLPDLFPTTFVFSNEDEAYVAINEARDRQKYFLSPEMRTALEEQARKTWIEQVVAKAGNNCALIVIRDNYTPAYAENAQAFEDCVKNKESCTLYYMLCPVWVAFNPNEQYNTKHWRMVKETSTVDYIYA